MCIDPWTVGDFGYEVEQGRRVLNCFVWMRNFPLDNYYAHPVEGLHALIDLSTLEILRVDDHFEAAGDYIPVPRAPLNFDADVLTEFRPPSAPLDVVQPAGPGYRVAGNLVTWENWDFRVGFNGREGLVLYTIGYYTSGTAAADCLSRLDRRDGRALRHARAKPLPQERVRQRRDRVRPDGQFAEARLRLSGRHPLFRRGGPGSVRQRAHDRQCDLSA